MSCLVWVRAGAPVRPLGTKNTGKTFDRGLAGTASWTVCGIRQEPQRNRFPAARDVRRPDVTCLDDTDIQQSTKHLRWQCSACWVHPFERGWRGFLSLREPGRPAGTAGPPPSLVACRTKWTRLK